MIAKSIATILLGLCAATGCLALPDVPVEALGCRVSGGAPCDPESVAAAAVTAADIKTIPAVDKAHYPDSIGYLYQGTLASILWLQSVPGAGQIDKLGQTLSRLMARGVTGEILTSAMQVVDTIPDTQPTLVQMAIGITQSVRLMAQYAFVTSDYEAALGATLGAYNADPARLQAIADTAARVAAEFHASAMPDPTRAPPAPPPPQPLIRPGKYFADVVMDRARERLASNAARMERAVSARNPTAYADAFTQVFVLQQDRDLSNAAVEALGLHHVDGLLRGQPLDAVIAKYVNPIPTPDQPLSMEQLALINQISLLSGDTSTPRQPLVAALLVIDEAHRQGDQDATLSAPLIWQHITDTAWLVSQLVRIKADGTTEDQVNAVIATIVATI